MIIDFHTHIFPEKIAAKAVGKLASIINLEPSINGCESDLIASMERAQIDVSVILPVVTDVRQFNSITRFASYINETYADRKDRRLISFAGIHPADPDCLHQLALIKREGFTGVKVHPNYQGMDFSDIRMKRMISRATELDLAVLTHAGFDPYTPGREFCTSDMILDVIKDVAPQKLILAHMGSNMYYDESEEKLCGQNVYMDTAYSIVHMTQDQFVRMVRKHGADKILFATDCPWAKQKTCVEILKNSALTDEEKEMILSVNARRLLNI